MRLACVHSDYFPVDVNCVGCEELWDIFYDSQMIETRRNRTLAKKMQPKGVSGLYGMTKKDRYKVEHGIANCTLERFIQEQNPR